jgi:hypothetical protein
VGSQSIIVIVIVIVLGIIAAHLALVQHINARATSLFRARDAKGLAQYLEKGYVRRLMPAYNHGCLVLAARELAGDEKGAQEAIDKLVDLAAPGAQLNDLATRAMNHYVSAGDSAGAHRFVNLLRTKGKADLCDELDKLVEIELDKSDKYLDEMTTALDAADAPTKKRLYALIAKQYENRGDSAKAQQARDAAKAC